MKLVALTSMLTFFVAASPSDKATKPSAAPTAVPFVDCGPSFVMELEPNGKSLPYLRGKGQNPNGYSFMLELVSVAFTGGVYTFITNQDGAITPTALIRVSVAPPATVAIYPVGNGAELGLPDLKSEFYKNCKLSNRNLLDSLVAKPSAK